MKYQPCDIIFVTQTRLSQINCHKGIKMIKRFRDKYGISQKDMALYFDVSRSFLAMLEMGARTPSDRIMERLEILEKFLEENQEEAISNPAQPDFPESLVESKIFELTAYLRKCEVLLKETEFIMQKNARARNIQFEKKENESQNENFLRFLAKDGLTRKIQAVDSKKHLELILQREGLQAQLNYLNKMAGNENKS